MHHIRQALLRMRQGGSDRDIAAARIMGRRKAGDLRCVAAAQGWLDAVCTLPSDEAIVQALAPPRRAASTVSSLEGHRQTVRQWIEQGVSGTAIHLALQRGHGWSGSYSAVRRLVADIRKDLPQEVTCRLEFAPGDAAQVDFGAGPVLTHPDGCQRRTWAFVMTLAHSRHQYVEFVWDQTVATWLGCHRRAFEWFGGVPARVVIDDAKCAITKACSQDPLVQRAYAECAEGYGFKIDRCPPHDPQKKGIVEPGVKYLKGNFLPLREFRDLGDLNTQAWQWVMQTAGLRCHGTTRQRPLDLFALERALLKPLPAIAPDLGTWHQVRLHKDCHLQFERVLYSAQFTLVGRVLWLRATDTIVALYGDYRHVCTHVRHLRPGQRVTLREHLPPHAQAFFAHDRQWCAEQAAHVGGKLPDAGRASAGRQDPGAAARRARGAGPAQDLRRTTPGGRLRPGPGARLTLLPHRQVPPGPGARALRRTPGGGRHLHHLHHAHPESERRACHRQLRAQARHTGARAAADHR